MTYDESEFLRDLKQLQKDSAAARATGTPFMGVVEEIEVHTHMGLYVLDVHNGRGSITSCAVLFSSLAKHELPLKGHSVSGFLNNTVNPINLGHRQVLPVVDFKNCSAEQHIDSNDRSDNVVWLKTSTFRKLDP